MNFLSHNHEQVSMAEVLRPTNEIEFQELLLFIRGFPDRRILLRRTLEKIS